MFSHNAIRSATTRRHTRPPHLIGSHAGSGTQLLVSDDVGVHHDELLQLPRVAEAVEGVSPVRVPVHLSN